MNRENLDDLTIICPTYNRPHMLNRVLKYYVDNNFSCKIIIADSSETGARNIVLDLVDKCSSRLNVEYFHMPESTDFGLKLYTASKSINCPFVNSEHISLQGESSLGSKTLVFILNLDVTCNNILPS